MTDPRQRFVDLVMAELARSGQTDPDPSVVGGLVFAGILPDDDLPKAAGNLLRAACEIATAAIVHDTKLLAKTMADVK